MASEGESAERESTGSAGLRRFSRARESAESVRTHSGDRPRTLKSRDAARAPGLQAEALGPGHVDFGPNRRLRDLNQAMNHMRVLTRGRETTSVSFEGRCHPGNRSGGHPARIGRERIPARPGSDHRAGGQQGSRRLRRARQELGERGAAAWQLPAAGVCVLSRLAGGLNGIDDGGRLTRLLRARPLLGALVGRSYGPRKSE